MSGTRIDARRAARQLYAECDRVIENWDGVARSQRRDAVPAMDAPPEAVTGLSATAEITVSVEWLAYMLVFLAEYVGPRGGAS